MGRAPRADGAERPYTEPLAWTMAIGVAYLPVSVAPAGCTADGLPVGVQIVGTFLEDRTPVAVAAALERQLGGVRPQPLALT